MDRTFQGLIAGLIAGVVFNIWNLAFSPYFQSAFIGILGIIFAHLLVKIASKGIIIKSALYGALLYFVFRAVAVIFNVTPLIEGQTFPGRLSNLLGAVLWGIILGFFLKRFDKIPENKGDIID